MNIVDFLYLIIVIGIAFGLIDFIAVSYINRKYQKELHKIFQNYCAEVERTLGKVEAAREGKGKSPR